MGRFRSIGALSIALYPVVGRFTGRRTPARNPQNRNLSRRKWPGYLRFASSCTTETIQVNCPYQHWHCFMITGSRYFYPMDVACSAIPYEKSCCRSSLKFGWWSWRWHSKYLYAVLSGAGRISHRIIDVIRKDALIGMHLFITCTRLRITLPLHGSACS